MPTNSTKQIDPVVEARALLAAITPTRFPLPSKQQHGLLNEYSCGCQVRRDSSGGYFIHLCQLHNRAPELLKTLADEVEALRVKLNDPCLVAGYHVCGGVHDLSDPWKSKEQP